MAVNKVIIIGHLGRDPESRSFQNGGKVVNFSVAVTEKWKSRDGERKEKTEWVPVAIFNEGIAGVAEKYLRKGSKVYVEGKFATRKWQDQSGQDRYSTEVVLQGFDAKLELLDSRRDGDGGQRQQDDRPNGGGGSAWDDAGPDLDDDVPFLTCNPSYEPLIRRRVVA